jgi:hypothetical protein
VPLCRRGGRLTFFCFAKKRRPWCLRPFASLRATSGARFKWGPARTRLAAQTIAGPDPLEAPLLGAVTRVLRGGFGIGIGFGVKFWLCNATLFIAACARSTWARGRNHPRARRSAWFFGVGSPFRCEAPAGRAEGAANLGSDPENARSRIALL